MGKKLTIEYIRDEFEKEGYTLLSEEYVNNSTKLNYVCSNEHKLSINWTSWQQGVRCPICAINNKKLTIEQVKNSFEQDEYILLSDKYINSKIKLDYVCNKGHRHSVNWSSWRQGDRCPTCDINNRRMPLSFIKEQFEKEGYTLLSEEYINSKTKLDYKCPNKHKHSITWHNWQKGYRCPYCYGNAKPTIDQVKKSFEQEEYILLSEEYINSKKQKLNYICSKGHKHSITWDSWRQGSRCPYCISTRVTLERIKESFDSCGYTLLSKEYFNNNTKLDYICSEGHKHNTSWHNWKNGHRCAICRSIKFSIKYSGSGGSNWQGGISYEPYCPIWKDKEYKEDIKIRDGNRCLNPYCDSKNPNDLVIHHIDYNKKNCGPKNLITVCRSCNNKANIDRDWHTTWYQAIIKNRYGGTKCP